MSDHSIDTPLQRGALESSFIEKNIHNIVGIDEVGRGCLAGPVVAACVRLNYKKLFTLKDKDRNLIRDSKKLSSKQRNKVLDFMPEICIEAHHRSASPDEIAACSLSRLLIFWSIPNH